MHVNQPLLQGCRPLVLTVHARPAGVVEAVAQKYPAMHVHAPPHVDDTYIATPDAPNAPAAHADAFDTDAPVGHQ